MKLIRFKTDASSMPQFGTVIHEQAVSFQGWLLTSTIALSGMVFLSGTAIATPIYSSTSLSANASQLDSPQPDSLSSDEMPQPETTLLEPISTSAGDLGNDLTIATPELFTLTPLDSLAPSSDELSLVTATDLTIATPELFTLTPLDSLAPSSDELSLVTATASPVLDTARLAQAPPSEESEPESSPEQVESPLAEPDLGERSRLTGDWGGVRSQLEEAGVTLNLEFTQFYQGIVPGTGCQAFGDCFDVDSPLDDDNPGGTFEYGGRLDGFIVLDTEKLGLWDGGRFHTHLEYRFGDLSGTLGNAFFPTNAGMAYPGQSADTLVATSLYLSQRIGDRGSLLIGKINALDLLANDLFFGGWGNQRFINSVFPAPPSGLIPPVFFGAIANVRLDPINLSFMVYDPDDRTQDYWPDDLFSNGVSFSLTTTYATQIGGRPTTFSLSGIYSTKTGVDFSEISDSFRAGLEPSTVSGSYNVGFQFSHLFHVNPNNPREGWGLFMKGAISDGNPNFVQNSIIVGVGGMGLFPGRELDSFGIGYYYYNLSDDLQEVFNTRKDQIGDEQGIEVYYSYALTPWFYLTADLQYIDPPRNSFEDALIFALRTNIRF